MARETFPYSYTSPYIHLWIFETLWVITFWVWVLTHPTPPLHDPPHPFMTHPTPSWPTPPHPTPPLHDPPTPPHPTPSWPTHPTPPHPTPPLVHFWAQRSLFSWAASLCLPLGRQSYHVSLQRCTWQALLSTTHCYFDAGKVHNSGTKQYNWVLRFPVILLYTVINIKGYTCATCWLRSNRVWKFLTV